MLYQTFGIDVMHYPLYSCQGAGTETRKRSFRNQCPLKNDFHLKVSPEVPNVLSDKDEFILQALSIMKSDPVKLVALPSLFPELSSYFNSKQFLLP